MDEEVFENEEAEQEKYAIIKLAARHSKLAVIKSQFVVARNYKSLFIHFDIETDDWADTALTAIFNDEYIRVLDSNMTCDVPEEALTEEGFFEVGLFGVKDDYRINTNHVRFKVWDGTYDEGIPGTDINQTLYEQIMAALAEKANKVYVDEHLAEKSPLQHTHTTGDITDYVEVTKQTVTDWGFAQDNEVYHKPDGGIPAEDLNQDVQDALNKANSALQNYTETDPTVPGWAKQPQKPTYTYDEIQGTPPEVDLTGYATEKYVDSKVENISNAVDQKVSKEDGKGLSSNDYTDSEKQKLESLKQINPVNKTETMTQQVGIDSEGKLWTAQSMQKIQSDWAQMDTTADDYIKNKPVETTQDEIIRLLIETDMIASILNSDGKLLADENGVILLI